ncbi:MAG: hypothetical protein IKP40_10065, partial [Clostridia bacterium]|nr:hypothetical protein [Clostridia bacterium]
DGADVDVGLCSVVMFLGHGDLLLCIFAQTAKVAPGCSRAGQAGILSLFMAVDAVLEQVMGIEPT